MQSLELKTSKNSRKKRVLKICKTKSLYISFAIIPLSILLFYGIEDKNVDFFKKVKNPDDYRTVYKKVVYHLGIMVSHYALIVILSIVGILISYIGHELFKLVKDSITRPEITIENKI